MRARGLTTLLGLVAHALQVRASGDRVQVPTVPRVGAGVERQGPGAFLAARVDDEDAFGTRGGRIRGELGGVRALAKEIEHRPDLSGPMMVRIGETGEERALVQMRDGLAELYPEVATRPGSIEGATLASHLVQSREPDPDTRLGRQVLIIMMIERVAQEEHGPLNGGDIRTALTEERALLRCCSIDYRLIAVREMQGDLARHLGKRPMVLQRGRATTPALLDERAQEPNIRAGVELEKLVSQGRLYLYRTQARQLVTEAFQHRPAIGVG